jgi:hypothetical protein
MKARVVRCKDGFKRQFIRAGQAPTLTLWKCFDCGYCIWTTKRKYVKKGGFLAELKAHTC